MSEPQSLKQHLMLQIWMSAAFPIGAFSCSHGMETAIQDGRIHDGQSCLEWIQGVTRYGSGWNGSVILANAYRLGDHLLNSQPWVTPEESARQTNAVNPLSDLNDLALALQAGAERQLEKDTVGRRVSGVRCDLGYLRWYSLAIDRSRSGTACRDRCTGCCPSYSTHAIDSFNPAVHEQLTGRVCQT